MPKKFQGTNSKASEAKARKAAQEAEKKEAKQKAEEDAFWADDDKHVNRKLNRKADAERKKEELAAKKAERDAMLAKENEALGGNSSKSEGRPVKVTQHQVEQERDRQAEIRRLEEEQRQKEKQRLMSFEVEENVNRLHLDEESARGVDQALRVLGDGAEAVDSHPEKRVKSAYKAFEEKMLPELRRDNPGLKMSQYRNMMRKEWERSPENPLNRQ